MNKLLSMSQEDKEDLDNLLNLLIKCKELKVKNEETLKEIEANIKEATYKSIKIMEANMLRKYTLANEDMQIDFEINTSISPTYFKDDDGNIISDEKKKALVFLEENGYLSEVVNVKGVSISDVKALNIPYDKIDIHSQTFKKIVNTLLNVEKISPEEIENNGIVINTFSDLKIKKIVN